MKSFIARKRFLFSAAVVIYLAGLSFYTLSDYFTNKKLHEKRLVESAFLTVSECKSGILANPDFLKSGIYSFYSDRIVKRSDADLLVVIDTVNDFEFYKDRAGILSSSMDIKSKLKRHLFDSYLYSGQLNLKNSDQCSYTIVYDYIDEKRTSLVASGFDDCSLRLQMKAELWRSLKMHGFFLMLIIPFLVVMVYVEEREKKLLLERIYTERLTGLPNRTKLFLDIELSQNPALFIINIDSFKEYNDLYGFEVGDFIILEMGRRLERIASDAFSGLKMQLYKLQADEYALLLKDSIEDEKLSALAARIISVISENSFAYKGYDMNVSVTVGITRAPSEAFISLKEKRQHSPVSRADMALKKAKADKKHFLVYDESMNIPEEYEENIRLTKLIKKSIKAGCIIPHYQPIVNNSSLKIEKYESLVRLCSEDGQIIYPSMFLPVAKKTKMYSMITRIMSEKTFEYFKDKDYEFSVNLSVDDILNEDTVAYINDLISIHGNSLNHKIIFEIVESEGIENFPKVKKFIENIKSFGCRIAIDDFGTGYSNFNYIGELNVDFIKIDASMIKNITSDKSSRIITETIVGFCQKMGIQTVAEFVHSKEVFEIVRNIGIDYSQGYYFGKPTDNVES